MARLDPLVASIEISSMLQRLTNDADIAKPDWASGLLAADHELESVEFTLRRDYIACLATQNRQHEKLWDAGYRLNSRYYEAYYALSQNAQKWLDGRTPRKLVAQLMARAIRYRELSYRYRLFRHEEWPPGTWLSVHKHFANICEMQLEDENIGFEKIAGSELVPLTPGREYVRLLLVKLCFSGNLSPLQLEDLTDHLHEGSSELKLTLNPSTEHGFYLDLSQPYGLRFLSRMVSGGQFLYLDTGLICDRFKALLASAETRFAMTSDPVAKRALQSQITIFSGAAARVDPNFKPALRTSQRVADRSPVWATVGISSSVTAIQSTRDSLMRSISEGGIYGNGDDMSTFGFVRQSTVASFRPQASAQMGNGTAIHRWELRDRSDTGFRCVASTQQAQSLGLGSLVAVNDDDLTEWNITTVVRIVRGSAGFTEIGLKTISRTPVGVGVQPLRTTLSPASRYNGNRPPLSVIGIVLRNAFLDTPIFPPTLIISRRDYDAGGKYRVMQGEKSDVVTLSDVIQEENEWVWVNFRVNADMIPV